MDWVVAGMTLLSMELIGRNMWQGWLVGLCNQAIWGYLLVYQRQMWGLAVLTVVLTWRYSAALLRWRREAA